MSLQISSAAALNGLYCTAALSLNLFAIQMGQGGSRFKSGERPPEDGGLGLGKAAKKKHGVEQSFGLEALEDSEKNKEARATTLRWTRNHSNALENVPLGLIVGWATTIAGGTPTQQMFFQIFAVSRWLHTITYAKQMQPHRALAWLGGWISIIGMLTSSIIALRAQIAA